MISGAHMFTAAHFGGFLNTWPRSVHWLRSVEVYMRNEGAQPLAVTTATCWPLS